MLEAPGWLFGTDPVTGIMPATGTITTGMSGIWKQGHDITDIQGIDLAIVPILMSRYLRTSAHQCLQRESLVSVLFGSCRGPWHTGACHEPWAAAAVLHRCDAGV